VRVTVFNSSPALRLSGSPIRTERGPITILALALTTALALCATACGYHLQGTGGSLPPAVKIIAVLPFERQVPVLQLDQRVTEAVTRELAQRARVKVQSTKDGADAILTGAITGYGVAPLSYDSAGRANRYQVTMSARVRLADRDGKVLFESQGYRFSEVYERTSRPGAYISEEVVAYDVVASDFARALVATILEAGPGDEVSKQVGE
jgi:outer membrane lipopolysaccharide assembly protein LptE/RlpB